MLLFSKCKKSDFAFYQITSLVVTLYYSYWLQQKNRIFLSFIYFGICLFIHLIYFINIFCVDHINIKN